MILNILFALSSNIWDQKNIEFLYKDLHDTGLKQNVFYPISRAI